MSGDYLSKSKINLPYGKIKWQEFYPLGVVYTHS